MNVSIKEIAEACKGSKEIEFSRDFTKVRRVDNKALPEQTGSLKKREAKAESKKPEESKVEEDVDEAIVRDEKGRIVFKVPDFENTHIIHYSTKDRDEKADEEYKVNWKSIETMISNKFEMIKVVYTRADKYEGDLAISSYRLNKKQFAELAVLAGEDIDGKKFDFAETKGEELKDFWQAQGNHF